MHARSKLLIIVISLLIAGVLISGCTDNKGSSNTTPSPQITGVATVPAGPLFSAGDIVKSPKGSSTTAWLVLGYDASTDMYERAFIYANPDGSWGYRMNSKTENSPRAVMEKVYTEKVDHVDPSSVPTSQPTAAVPTPGIGSTTTEPVSTSTAAVTTTTISGKPSIKKIIPDEGIAGTSVQVTDLTGENFATGATVKLSKSENPDIIATGVNVNGGTSLTCTLPIPVNATPGAWDVVVTNPDGQFATFTNIFSVHYDPSVAVTTSGSNGGSSLISSISPGTAFSGTNVRMNIYGSTFPTTDKKIILRKIYSSDIIGSSVYMPTTTQIQVSFDIPSGSQGIWDVIIFGSDGTTVLGSLTGGFTIN